MGEASVRVVLDGEELFTWAGELNRTFGGIGFSAATGTFNNWHLIDDVRITTEEAVPPAVPPSVSISTDKVDYTTGDIMFVSISISNPSDVTQNVVFNW